MVDESLVTKVGGQEKLDSLVDKVIEKLLEDPRIHNRFLNKNIDHIRDQMKIYISAVAKGLPPATSLPTAHAGLGITSAEYDIIVGYYEKAAWELGCMHDTSQQVSSLVNSLRESVINK